MLNKFINLSRKQDKEQRESMTSNISFYFYNKIFSNVSPVHSQESKQISTPQTIESGAIFRYT